MNRGIIQAYDHYRGGDEYQFDNCRHLACTEVRAAIFSEKCGYSTLKQRPFKEEVNIMEYVCVKNLAIEKLSENSICAKQAEVSVNRVFDVCSKDYSPFMKNKAVGTKTNNII